MGKHPADVLIFPVYQKCICPTALIGHLHVPQCETQTKTTAMPDSVATAPCRRRTKSRW